MKNGHESKINPEKHKELKITDVRTKIVTKNKKIGTQNGKDETCIPFKSLVKHALSLNYLANTCF